MPQAFFELRIVADDQLREPLIGILSQLGIEGFWEDDATLKCYVNARRWTPAMLDEIRSTANMVARSSSSLTPKISLSVLKDQNWNEEWEKSIRPIRVSDRIVITPSWHKCEPTPGQIVLTIDPKMSFGTGYHETTRLSLKLIERHCMKGMTVLDIGTGTGILAIAAVKLGAASVVAIDTDEWAYQNAIENVHMNDVGDRVKIALGDITCIPPQEFDMIVANIQRSVLQQLLGRMRQCLATDGVLLLSGLLASDEEPMIESLHTAGFRMMEEAIENEWISLAATTRPEN